MYGDSGDSMGMIIRIHFPILPCTPVSFLKSVTETEALLVNALPQLRYICRKVLTFGFHVFRASGLGFWV